MKDANKWIARILFYVTALLFFGALAYFAPWKLPFIGQNRIVAFFAISLLFFCYIMIQEYKEAQRNAKKI